MPFQKGHRINLGKKHSKKTRKAISQALIGNVPWNKGKKGLVISWSKGLTKETNASLKRISQKLKGRNNPSYRANVKLGRKCLVCKKVLTRKQILENRKFCSWDCVKKHRKQNGTWNKGLKGYNAGHKNYVKDLKKRREYALLGRQALDRSKEPTNIEKIVYDYLEKKGIVFEKQKLINKRFLVDAYIPSLNLIIEADGEYWHNLDKIKRKDKAENAYLKKCGFDLIRLKESAIMNGSFERKLNKWL